MLVLHLSASADSMLLWGETSSRTEAAASPFSPLDAEASALAEAVRPFLIAPLSVKEFATYTAFLPTAEGVPLPSSPLLGDSPLSTPTLSPWSVTAIELDAASEIALLRACQVTDVLAPDVRVGATLRYWATVYRFARALISRHQVVPDIVEDEGDYHAVWTPVFAGEDAARIAALAKAMPGACRALIAAGKPAPKTARKSEAPETPAATVLETELAQLCDALMRPPATAELESPTRKPARGATATKFDSLHHQWLHALQTPDGALTGDGKALVDFARTIRSWQRPLSVSLAAPFRLCFRLEEPSAAELDEDDDATWQVQFLLQSVADPSLFVPAGEAWSSGGEAARLLAAPRFQPREFLLTALGEAARICPEISDSLKDKRSSGYSLDLAGAQTFLTERAYLLEQAGFVVQLPAWWSKRGRPKLTGSLRAKSPKMQGGSGLTLESMVSFDYDIALDGEPLTAQELEQLARAKQSLVRLRGQWVQLDADQIATAIAYWKKKGSREASLKELVRMALGATDAPGGITLGAVQGDGAVGDLLGKLTGERPLEPLPIPSGFIGTLRPYQERGYSWLRFLTDLGMGACLADDMGLGKSAQTIALLLSAKRPSLVVCPTSVVGNWQRELARFAPSLRVLAHHGPDRLRGEALVESVRDADVLVTSYALLQRDVEALQQCAFTGVVADEAQNIKNPETKQSRAARTLTADWRVALSGTPVENHVGDLWAIFEFLNPGLLGSEGSFKREFYAPIHQERDESAALALKKRTGPLILRRLKTDKTVIADLPDKIEQEEHCPLTPEQASLYEAVLRDVEERLDEAEGMARRGLVLATLTRLKQVCNHPAQFLADGSPLPKRSGKLSRLTELADEIVSADDRALIFTQFAEMGGMIQRHLRETLGREVLFLHGGVSKKGRDEMVQRFQTEGRAPLFVLSLKAGGVGLNLTAASHVIHFDRWWNPAVEDQATDRAFRIGQVKNVMVRKFVCQGTLEERITEMIARKRDIAGSVVGTGESWLTELSTGDLKSLLALSRERAVEEVS